MARSKIKSMRHDRRELRKHRERANARKRQEKQRRREQRRGVEPDVPVAVMDRQQT